MLEEFVSYSSSAYKNISNKRISKQDIGLRVGFTFIGNTGFELIDEFYADWGNEETSGKFNAHFEEIESQVTEMVWHASPYCQAHYLFSEKRCRPIIRILRRKAPHLFLKNNLNLKDFSVLLEKSSLKKNELYFVNDDVKSKINNSSNFSFVNLILSVNTDDALDINAALQEISSIESDGDCGLDELLEGI